MFNRLTLAAAVCLVPAVADAQTARTPVVYMGEAASAATLKLCASGCTITPIARASTIVSPRRTAPPTRAPRALHTLVLPALEADGERKLDELIASLD